MFGSKKVILQLETRLKEQTVQYESRITDLKSQIEDLRKLVYSANSATNVPMVALEADAIITGKEEVYEISESEAALEEQSEADRIFSGNYDYQQ